MIQEQERHKLSSPTKGISEFSAVIGWDRNVTNQIVNGAPESYSPFDRLKKITSQGVYWRHIDNPVGPLKELQTRITNRALTPIIPNLPSYLVGGLPGRSLIENANPHLGHNVVAEYDLESCFDFVTPKMVNKKLIEEGYGRGVASVITKACTLQNRLPQGSPASVILCNLALGDMAAEINEFAEQNECNFTLYVDDITVSGDEANVKRVMLEIPRIVTRHHMKINGKKTEIFSSNRAQPVTGLLTNGSLTVPKDYYEKIRTNIITLSKEKQPVNKRMLDSVWSQIHYVAWIDRRKGLKLHQFGAELLSDVETYKGGKLLRTPIRKCSSVKNSHLVPQD